MSRLSYEEARKRLPAVSPEIAATLLPLVEKGWKGRRGHRDDFGDKRSCCATGAIGLAVYGRAWEGFEAIRDVIGSNSYDGDTIGNQIATLNDKSWPHCKRVVTETLRTIAAEAPR